MSLIFTPSGTLNVAHDPSELPETSNGTDSLSGAMVRCKNLRIDQRGIAKLRDGSFTLNETAIGSPVWWIEEQGGLRYSFAGGGIYLDEVVLETGLAEAQWSAIKYNPFNDTSQNVYALNGIDRKRIEGEFVSEWGLDAPAVAPTVRTGGNGGLTGEYSVRYTYVRKIGDLILAESDPSPASETIPLNNASLSGTFTQPSDPQVTHVRIYRTSSGGATYMYDQELPVDVDYIYGYCFDWELGSGSTASEEEAVEYGITFEWEDGEDLFTGGSYKFSISDSAHGTQNVYGWETQYTEAVSWDASISATSTSGYGFSSTVTAPALTVSVSDAISPTYSWVKLSGDSISAVSPSSASTTFRGTGMAYGELRNATFRCTVTDIPYSESFDVTVSVFREHGGGGGPLP